MRSSKGSTRVAAVDTLGRRWPLRRYTLTGAGGKIFRGNTSEAGNRRQWPVEGGRVTVPSLPPGLWTLQVAAPDGASWSGSVAVAPGAAAAVTCTAGRCFPATEAAAVE